MAPGSGTFDTPNEGAAALASAAYRYNCPTYLFVQTSSTKGRQTGQVRRQIGGLAYETF